MEMWTVFLDKIWAKLQTLANCAGWGLLFLWGFNICGSFWSGKHCKVCLILTFREDLCTCLHRLVQSKLQAATIVKKVMEFFFFFSFLLLRHLAWLLMYIRGFFYLPLGSCEKFLHIHLQLWIFVILQVNHYSSFLKAWVSVVLGLPLHIWQQLFLEMCVVKATSLKKAGGSHSLWIIACLKYSVDII